MGNRFFKPYIGSNYQRGIHGKKILVVGASFYCNYSECPYFSDCTDVIKKNSAPYDLLCPYYSKKSKQLHNEPSYCIEDIPKTYQIFTNFLSQLLGNIGDYYDIWSYLAFTNYVQFFLPAGDYYRDTKDSDISDRDFEAFNETLIELQPNIVIIWGCVFNSYVKERNPYLINNGELGRTEGYICHLLVPGVIHPIAIINSYHPSSSAWHSGKKDFEKYFNQLITI